jgi:hypothetical protein
LLLLRETEKSVGAPIVCDNDKDAVDFAMATSGPVDSENVRIVWIKNTSKLSEMWISQGLLNEAREKENLEILDKTQNLEFDERGNLIEI